MKTYITIIVFIALFIGAGWTFNHLNAWIGVLLFLILIGAIIYVCEEELKKNQRKINRNNKQKIKN